MTSRLGSKDNIKHVPGGGNVSNVTACGVAVVQTNTVPHDALMRRFLHSRAARNAAKSIPKSSVPKTNHGDSRGLDSGRFSLTLTQISVFRDVFNHPVFSFRLSCVLWFERLHQMIVCSQVQILNKKVDLSKVASKCGSKANIKHKPGMMRAELAV